MNHLGLGLEPATADWGLMISENRQPLAVDRWATAVPAALFAALVIGLNLLADSYARSSVGSSADGTAALETTSVV